jgi:hypothetical protein
MKSDHWFKFYWFGNIHTSKDTECWAGKQFAVRVDGVNTEYWFVHTAFNSDTEITDLLLSENGAKSLRYVW